MGAWLHGVVDAARAGDQEAPEKVADAVEAADLTIVGGDPRAAAVAVRLLRATLRTIKTNLGWAFGYNVAALPRAQSITFVHFLFRVSGPPRHRRSLRSGASTGQPAALV